MKVNGLITREMDLVSSNGLMGPSILANGDRIKLMERASSCLMMGIFMKVNGKMIKQMAMVYI